MNEFEIRETIRGTRFADSCELLMAGGQPSIRLHTDRTTMEELPLGKSRLGGFPDIPAGPSWPRSGDRPLEMIAQIDLAEAANCFPLADLPKTGWLVFFYAGDRFMPFWKRPPDAWCPWQVTYFDCAVGDLVRLEPPPRPERTRGPLMRRLVGSPKQQRYYHPVAIRFEQEFRLVDDDEAPNRIDVDVRDKEAWIAYENLWESIGHWSDATQHRLRGHPDSIQGPMRREAAETAAAMGLVQDTGGQQEYPDSDWELLLQIDTDKDGPGWMWGDGGRIYFWIRRQDLRMRDFSKVCCIQQCG